MADKKFNIKDQLAGIAALIAAIVAIGGGFVKYGEITTKLADIEARESIDHSAQIAVIEEKVAALESKKGVDLTSVQESINTKGFDIVDNRNEINKNENEINKNGKDAAINSK